MIKLDKLNTKIAGLHEGYEKLVTLLEAKCWGKTKLEKKIKYVSSFDEIELITSIEHHEKLIPQNFFTDYRKWYSLGKGILDVNGDKEKMAHRHLFWKTLRSYSFKTCFSFMTCTNAN